MASPLLYCPPSHLRLEEAQGLGTVEVEAVKKIAAGYRDDGKQAVPGLLPMPNDNNGSSSGRRYNNSQPDQPTSCYDPEEDVTNDIIQAKRSRSPSTPTIRPSQSSKRVKLVDEFGECTNDLQETVHRLLPTGRRGGSEFGDGSPSMRQISATKGAVDYRSTLSSGPTTMSTIPHQKSPSSMLHMLQKKVLQLFETALLSPYANQQ